MIAVWFDLKTAFPSFYAKLFVFLLSKNKSSAYEKLRIEMDSIQDEEIK